MKIIVKTEELKQEIVNNLNNLSPIGSLFGVIHYNTYNDLNSFITNLKLSSVPLRA